MGSEIRAGAPDHYGNLQDGRITDPAFTFTWEELIEHGVPLDHLRPGDRFVCVLPATKGGCGSATYTGKLIYPGIGSSLVQLDRNWEDVVRWQPQSPVIPLPKQTGAQPQPPPQSQLTEPKSRPRRVSLNPDKFTDEE